MLALLLPSVTGGRTALLQIVLYTEAGALLYFIGSVSALDRPCSPSSFSIPPDQSSTTRSEPQTTRTEPHPTRSPQVSCRRYWRWKGLNGSMELKDLLSKAAPGGGLLREGVPWQQEEAYEELGSRRGFNCD